MLILDSPLATRDDLRLEPVTFDLYRDIHKGIRAELFGVTLQAGSLDPADTAGRIAMSSRVRALADLLESHAHHEDSVMQGSIERYLPVIAEQVVRDHDVLGRRIDGLVTLAEATALAPVDQERHTLYELYLGLGSFTSSYLAHIDVEERTIMPALSAALDVPALVEMHDAIVGSIPPEEMARSLSLMLPAMNHEDRVEMLSGIRASAPAEVFEGVAMLAADVLTPPAHDALMARVGR